MARSIELELRRAGVEVRLGTSVTALREAGGGTVTASLSDGFQVPADLVLLAVGVRPETSLAAAAGLALGNRGALLVDEHLRTSVPSIYAVGDAIEVTDAVTGGPALVPLAGPANRQGRAAADHLFGRGGRRSPVLGTAIVRVFGTVAAATGPGEKALSRGRDPAPRRAPAPEQPRRVLSRRPPAAPQAALRPRRAGARRPGNRRRRRRQADRRHRHRDPGRPDRR